MKYILTMMTAAILCSGAQAPSRDYPPPQHPGANGPAQPRQA